MNHRIVKHLIYPIHERIMGRKTFSYLQDLEQTQWMDRSLLEEMRFQKLKTLLIHAQREIPFYSRRFEEAGFDPQTMRSTDEIAKLPLLTKSEIRNHLNEMIWKDCPGGLFRYNTGGSSGEPLIFYFDKMRQAYDKAARMLTHRWWGIDVGEKELYLWGSPVEITKQDRLKSLRDRLTNELLLSAFDVSPVEVPRMVATLRKFRPACVFGYPSTIALFCKFAEEKGLILSDTGVRVVFSTAEVLYEHQRKAISEAFGGVPVADGYGSREGGFISHQCREGAYHVIDPNYVIEYLKDGEPVAPGEDGEIVITHLDAFGMPFIRYRTGDVARCGEDNCPCGRTWSTMSHIQGRTTDFIVSPDGRWQHALSLIYIVRDIEGVKEFKIIQEAVDEIRVLLEVHVGLYPQNGDERIVAGFQKRVGDGVKIIIEKVHAIPRDASGKYRYVVSKVAEKGLQGCTGRI